MAKQKATGLYTDQRGRITCREHAPYEGTDTWVLDQWKPLTKAEAARFETEIGRVPACETCSTAGNTQEIATETAPAEVVPVADAPATKPRKSKKEKPASDAPAVTLEQICEGYVRHLEDSGKSVGTSFSYRLELTTAMEELGAKTLVSDITPARVLEYFVSDRVTRTRTGVEKAPPTIKKSRRVLRLALAWAQEAGLIEKAPLPEDAATY